MKEELTKNLVDKYPDIFREYFRSRKVSAMAVGFMCGDGWYNLIDNLCAKIKEVTDNTEAEVIALQVKSKFAGLRFYYTIVNSTDEISDKVYKLIREAERQSFKTCETCGKEGSLKGKSWVWTLCDECEKKVLT